MQAINADSTQDTKLLFFFPTNKRSSSKTHTTFGDENPNKIKKYFCFSEKSTIFASPKRYTYHPPRDSSSGFRIIIRQDICKI